MTTNKLGRRSFIKISATTLAASPLLGLNPALAADEEKLKEDDPTAIALGYKEKTADVDASKYPKHNSEQICSACVLYQGDDPDWGACGIFPGKLVAGGGWCSAYAAKPS